MTDLIKEPVKERPGETARDIARVAAAVVGKGVRTE